MSVPTGLGHEVAAGFLADPDDFARLRRQATDGGWAECLHHQFLANLDAAPSSDLALAAAITQDSQWLDRALPALLKLIRQPQSTYVQAEAGCISLTGVHHAHTMCLAVDWLWPALNRDQREAAVSTLIAHCAENLSPMPDGIRNEDERGRLLFRRRLDRNDPFCLHPQPHQLNNWDMWFAGNLYMIAVLAERAFLTPGSELVWGHYHDTGYELTQERVDTWKAIALEAIRGTVRNQVGEDGDIAEGISYANYGGTALVIALIAAARTGGPDLIDDSICRFPLWQHNQLWPGGAVNFNDAKRTTTQTLQNVALLARQSRDPRLQHLLVNDLQRRPAAPPSGLLLVGSDSTISTTPWEPPRSTAYTHTGTVIWRPRDEATGLFVALQSGAHGGAHQHQDRNQFFLAAGDEPLLVDSGDCRYLKPPCPAFSSTVSHNCILIDGQGQTGDNQTPTTGRLLEHADQPWSTALFDAGNCYTNADHVFRRAVYLDDRALLIADRVTGNSHQLTWLAQGFNGDGAATWTCDDRHLVLRRPRRELHLFLFQTIKHIDITNGPLDGKPSGILRLAAHLAGARALVLCLVVETGEEVPLVTWDNQTMSVTLADRVLQIQQDKDEIRVNNQPFRC